MQIVLIGAGPRNLVLTERLVAYAQHTGITSHIHLIDPYPIGGHVWQTNQNPLFLANTIASQLTLFTDATIQKEFPGLTGPNLYDWASQEAEHYLQHHHFEHQSDFLNELSRLTPNNYTSRGLFGVYAQWFFEQVLTTSQATPADITVTHNIVTQLIPDKDHGYQLTLANGQQLKADYVVLTPGHLAARPNDLEATFTALAKTEADRHYLPPMHPSDAPLALIPAKEDVLIRGLGLSFFDYMIALTVGRGGRFTRNADQSLVYQPSGLEPHLIAGSRRGLPPHARGINQKQNTQRLQPHFLTPVRMKALAQSHQGYVPYDDFMHLVRQELSYKYYRNVVNDLSQTFPFASAQFVTALKESNDLEATAQAYAFPPAELMDWEKVMAPNQSVTADQSYTNFLIKYLKWDIHDAKLGNLSAPYAGAFDILRDLRNQIRHYLADGYFTPTDYQKFLTDFSPLNNFIAVGPPLLRMEQMSALMQAGILTITGPQVQASIGRENNFMIEDIYHHQWFAPNLIEARLPGQGLSQTKDELLVQLQAASLINPATVKTAGYPSLSLNAAFNDRTTLQALTTSGRPVPALYVWGIPTEGWNWFTTSAPRPDADDKALNDAEHIAHNIFTQERHKS
ncbi:FAD/NAD(P)-binding protein [Weissella halotolerans]|uniref:FAD(NAD)-dependent oxidoreductase n=1 Tax=Weissella halotolerans DSM 20190 TaxID=1123500 RepID=A0A0R2G5Z2_9LACO|nr:FAD/NAD(P)-binding protein [Weissella halotolerans]KRN32196.1 FAD(NAD)-dependent oxidoreductase [Weissella halotolerans DSM 20190]